ncbi:hypothetical protein ABIE44_001079 [Marmoricola sp. OAE513]|uniref:hypothetical protein n=1 Tax=Marmoricola sp. OAE513 TaxID=2817894 RepID=UPI001AE6F122
MKSTTHRGAVPPLTTGVVLATLVLLMSVYPARAGAAVPACIANGDYGAMVTVEDVNGPANDDSRGTRSDMYVSSVSTFCQRVSSVYVQDPISESGMEFGWVVGYSQCDGQTYSVPTLFYWAQRNGAKLSCNVFHTRHPTTYDTFEVSNTNANNYWGVYTNGTSLLPNGAGLGFSKGYSLTGTERGSSQDPGSAVWNDLQEFHDGSPGDHWSAWDRVQLNYDHDPTYHFHSTNSFSASSVHD